LWARTKIFPSRTTSSAYYTVSSPFRSPPFSSGLHGPSPRPSVYPAIDPELLYAAQSFSGKVVLVTGASRGVGRETALQYARAGASVAIVARTGGALDETRDIIVAAVPGVDVLVLNADVRDVESVRTAVESALRHFGKLDILIANAGAITLFTPREDRSLATISPFGSMACLRTDVPFISSKCCTRRTLMHGGTPSRSTSAGSSTLLGTHSLCS
jgi:hypothetical protein